jgi:hypothetical protein
MTETKYLGETIVSINETPFANFKPQDWVVYFIERYGQYDGGHHKQWVMDQVVRILKGTIIEVKLAKWNDGTVEYRVSTGEPSQEYKDWVQEMLGDYNEEEEEYEYYYDEGIAP